MIQLKILNSNGRRRQKRFSMLGIKVRMDYEKSPELLDVILKFLKNSVRIIDVHA